jgi:predicted extracellular nuclease
MNLRALVRATALLVLVTLSQIGSQVSAQSTSGLVISQVYGGGGNSGAPFTNDFVELFNRSAAPISLAGRSVQYASATGTGNFSANAVAVLSGTLQPGQYYLVRLAGGAAGVALPAADATGTVNMSGTAGKVALVDSATGLACNGGSTPCSAAQQALILDLVGFGGANYFEGTAAAPLLSNTTAAIRGANGCQDTNQNAADFTAAAPAPRNTASALSPCNGPTNPAFASAVASPSSVEPGQPLTVFATVLPGTNPTSTGLSVVGDLSSVGGSSTLAFADDGVAPDVAAADNIFTAQVMVAATLGAKSLPLTVTDAQSRAGNTSASVTVIPPPVIYLPHEVQGPGATSPFPVATAVTVRGVVTARKFNGFFIQTEPGSEDADPNSSEGLFVFVSGGGPAAAQVGRLVDVTGSVAEFISSADPGSAPLTELNLVTTVVDRGAASVPAPYALTLADVSDAGPQDQLERLEGMRVSASSLTAVTGTGGNKSEANATSTSDGTFYVVLTGQARPYREPGVEVGYPVIACAIGPCNIPVFDGNPERLRVDSDALEGMPKVDLSTGAVMTDVSGPLDFGFRTYTILPEAPLAPVGGATITAAPAAGGNQFTVASFNMERFYDAVNDPGGDVALTALAYQTRLAKASLAIRTILNTPDIIGVQEVEKLSVLQDIAARVDADAAAAGDPAPSYTAVLVEGNDQGGIDVGFLARTAGGRVTVTGFEQEGAAATFIDPGDNSVDLLNDRPPLVLHALIQGPATSLPQSVTVIANHLRSLIDVELPDNSGLRVRAKRQAQAEFLASYIQGRQVNDPAEAIISVGDYNAFSFNDGYGDSMGTIRGVPTPADQVATASPDLVSPDLVDLADFIPAADRYSYSFGGNAQTLDHVIVTANLVPQFAALVHPRVNADFAEVLRGDASTPQRLSDHDPAVAYFTFPADVVAPVFTTTVTDQTLEATGPGGATATFATPTATDNLDATVAVACAPVSGSTFPLGSTGVTCSATDLAGNTTAVSFSITVQDTTAPAIVVPADITGVATSPAGKIVSFSTSATDLVTAAPLVSCSPASGATFPVGSTTVACTAADLAGNTTSASFTVTITPVVPGRILGAGSIGTGNDRVWFSLDVRESASAIERGWLVLKVADRPGRPDRYFAASVADVQFSNAPGYAPGRRPGSGVDTVQFTGVGYWNGLAGHTFEVTASDRGEPGRGHDTFSTVIKNPLGVIVATASGTLRDGNLQSLR